jgi:hypothetical protein
MIPESLLYFRTGRDKLNNGRYVLSLKASQPTQTIPLNLTRPNVAYNIRLRLTAVPAVLPFLVECRE